MIVMSGIGFLEDTEEILGEIMKRQKVDYVPKWLEELLLSYLKND